MVPTTSGYCVALATDRQSVLKMERNIKCHVILRQRESVGRRSGRCLVDSKVQEHTLPPQVMRVKIVVIVGDEFPIEEDNRTKIWTISIVAGVIATIVGSALVWAFTEAILFRAC